MKKLILFLTILITSAYANSIVIATGGKTGTYYKKGNELNQASFRHKAKVINTAGSVENMLLVAKGKAEIAFVQADALEMLEIFYTNTQEKKDDLVNIINVLYKETLHILVRKNSKINALSDLNGKIMSAGGTHSGSTVTAAYISEAYNIDYAKIVDKNIVQSLKLLSRGKIDVLFYVSKAPTDALKHYKNLRLLDVSKEITNNPFIKKTVIPKGTYSFMPKDVNTYGVNTLIITSKQFQEADKINTFLKNNDIQEYVQEETTMLESISLDDEIEETTENVLEKLDLQVPQSVLEKYTKIYGNGALIRLKFFKQKINKMKNENIAIKLNRVNNLVNQAKFAKDIDHWRKENHWAMPLEFIGTTYGDSEEFAILKFIILSNLGIESSKLKFIQKDIDLKVKNKRYKENISLAYFAKPNQTPIILDYNEEESKIYKYDKSFNYKIIASSTNKKLSSIFNDDFSKSNIKYIMSNIK